MTKKTLAEKKNLIADAAKVSKEVADKVTDPLLHELIDQADELTKIFRKLKITDPDTYKTLVRIVNEETRKNIAIGNIVTRLKALGKAGIKLAGNVSQLTGTGALAALGSALGKKK